MIVLLEDDLERVEFFKSKFKNKLHHFTNPYDCSDFIRANHEKIDCVFLDHDICFYEHEMYGMKEITGLHVVRAMINDNCVRRDLQIVVHSLNSVGSKNMIVELRNNNFTNIERIPFDSLIVRI